MKLPNRSSVALKPTLSLFDTIALVTGTIVGAGIFETPSFVAAYVSRDDMVLPIWGLGGAISLVGALCYAELATNYPHPGGTYHYLRTAFGTAVSFLFVWTRMSVIQTGSIALLAFVFGDYASQLWPLGSPSAAIYAAIAILLLTGLNMLGVRPGKGAQASLATVQIVGLFLLSIVGLGISALSMSGSLPKLTTHVAIQVTNTARADAPVTANVGLAMVFVLLTYGGWNEAAYLSAEIRDGQRNIVRALVWSIGIVTALYLLINWTLIQRLGLAQMANSQAVVADLMRLSLGEVGATLTSCLVAVATLCSLNATIFTGARANYALGRDFSVFAILERGWRSTPTNALIVQGSIALLLVAIGTFARQGFETMVGYTAPAFWFFFLLSGLSLFILRRRRPNGDRAFSVPFYPLTPLLFCGVCAYMLQASLAYTGWGGLLGVFVMLLGLPLLWWARVHSRVNS